MSNPDLTLRVIRQGRALVRAIEALGTIDPIGWFERAITRLLLAAYKRLLPSGPPGSPRAPASGWGRSGLGPARHTGHLGT